MELFNYIAENFLLPMSQSFFVTTGVVMVVTVAGLAWGLCRAAASNDDLGPWKPISPERWTDMEKKQAEADKRHAEEQEEVLEVVDYLTAPSPELRELEKKQAELEKRLEIDRAQASVDLDLPGPNACSFAPVDPSLLLLSPSDTYQSWTRECDNLRREVKAVQAANGAAIAGDLFGRIKTCLETLVEAAVDKEGRCPPLSWDMPRPKLGGFHKDRNWAQQTIKWLNDRPVLPPRWTEDCCNHPEHPLELKKSPGITPEMKAAFIKKAQDSVKDGTKEESDAALAEVTREIESIVKTKALEFKSLHLGGELNGLLLPNGEHNPGVVPQPDDAPCLFFLYVRTLGVLKETMASKDEHWLSLDDRVSTLHRLKALANGLADALHSVSTWLGPKAASGLASRILRDNPNPSRAFAEDALAEYLAETEKRAAENPIEFAADWSDRNWDLPRSSEASATNPSNVVYPDERNN